jgi:hypothetical protein
VFYRPGEMVTSDEGVKIREKVWDEILDAMEEVRPDIRSMIAF